MNKPKCIIVDLDGTLALFEGRRNPYDCSKCDEVDEVNPAVMEVIKLIHFRNETYKNILAGNNPPRMSIILMSGRDSKYRDPTVRWLNKNCVPYDHLYMRVENDRRNDAIIKRELFDAHVANYYDVSFILDDRSRVVDLWRKDLGLHCFQVNYGDF